MGLAEATVKVHRSRLNAENEKRARSRSSDEWRTCSIWCVEKVASIPKRGRALSRDGEGASRRRSPFFRADLSFCKKSFDLNLTRGGMAVVR